MIVVIQRVSEAKVTIDNVVNGEIGCGLMLLAGFEAADTMEDLQWTAGKIVRMRIFPDENNVMNKSILDVGGDILLVSQFTLQASTKKGNRPSYINAAPPEIAIPLYEQFINELELLLNKKIQTGIFGADMQVQLINDGPVTIIMDSKNKK
ncbi:MAG: D-aminoacyl-tRNA deacylase [Bacteroidales bacterium]|jgi:D-aminoacyl-tRNA deacylase|nr:D-aminoacyl-tRNA deacylase [Bacteroidales bacterium]MDD2205387.1 D-aminoacyl-tRNA deacylase [Bacteroidales bacterium]MDD3914789.1 D-aminoacyl-tRNA deacylase [Bacteroidales bacterium]MDD4634934.1 D-aminoacyl-tRNA deacylase [Bacteroidales bacterium]